jgi:DNA-binding transcriptional LysR family regulator
MPWSRLVEWRELEIFLTLADELHFGRTADRLHLTQSRVSQTIRALERRVGGELFERTSRRVRLTPLGERFRDELRPGYEQILRAFESTRDNARGIVGELRISLFSLIVGGPSFGQIVRRFEDAHPLCVVQLGDAATTTGLDQARDGDIDVVVAYLPLAQADLTIGPVLSRRPRVLLVAADHPLVARGYVTAEDLADLPVSVMQGLPTETRDAISPPQTPSGRPVSRLPISSTATGTSVLSMVATGRICHPTIAGILDVYNISGLVELPLHGLPMIESALAWVTSRESAAIRAFAKCAEEIV